MHNFNSGDFVTDNDGETYIYLFDFNGIAQLQTNRKNPSTGKLYTSDSSYENLSKATNDEKREFVSTLYSRGYYYDKESNNVKPFKVSKDLFGSYGTAAVNEAISRYRTDYASEAVVLVNPHSIICMIQKAFVDGAKWQEEVINDNKK